MATGYIMLLLNAHLPFVRHPEHNSFLEENWLFEAISETYLPLLRVMDRLEADGVPFKLSISLSPTLAAMLGDELLQGRYISHLEKLLDLAEKEIVRTRGDDHFYRLALMYRDLYRQSYQDFTEKYERNILRGLDYYYKRGRIDVMASAATHAYLPLYQSYPQAVNAQVELGAEMHARTFGKSARGFWLPEAGYFPGIEDTLKQHGFRYFFTAAHGVLFAYDQPKAGVYRPIQCPNGLYAFGRDLHSANSVWSPEEGYPADFSYRDFYRDIGYDLPLDYIGPYIHEGGIRIPTGFKYHAVTGRTDQKMPYNPAQARRTAGEHAENFVYNQLNLVRKLSGLMDNEPVIFSPYDAELFGHWWFEGPGWLEQVIRRIHETNGELVMTTPREFLKEFPEQQVVQPSFSSWGNKGYSEVWLDGSNDWIYRHTHKAIERMTELVERFPNEKSLKERALAQAAREVLLSLSSDWPFIMRAGTTVPYAERRVREHIHNFTTIFDSLCRGSVSTEWLTRIEKKNNIFPDIDYRIFSSSRVKSGGVPMSLLRR